LYEREKAGRNKGERGHRALESRALPCVQTRHNNRGIASEGSEGFSQKSMNAQEQEYATYKEVKARFAMNRFMLYSLAREGKIKSVSLRRPGKRWGIRLFHLPSVREFLESLEEGKQI